MLRDPDLWLGTFYVVVAMALGALVWAWQTKSFGFGSPRHDPPGPEPEPKTRPVSHNEKLNVAAPDTYTHRVSNGVYDTLCFARVWLYDGLSVADYDELRIYLSAGSARQPVVSNSDSPVIQDPDTREVFVQSDSKAYVQCDGPLANGSAVVLYTTNSTSSSLIWARPVSEFSRKFELLTWGRKDDGKRQ